MSHEEALAFVGRVIGWFLTLVFPAVVLIVWAVAIKLIRMAFS